MNKIDINFDYREDSNCGDPDADSKKLYADHKLLWTKPLPCGNIFDLEVITKNGKYGRLLIKNNNINDNFSSDRMCPHFDGTYRGKFDGWLPSLDIDELKRKVRKIGGHIIFPAHRRNGFTINQARGINRKICDRFDLTLECIRKFYITEESPLYDTLSRYKDFFNLFIDFNGYIDFFMLQDFLDKNGKIKFYLPFDNFNRNPLPQSIEEYNQYRIKTLDLINNRNKRIYSSLIS